MSYPASATSNYPDWEEDIGPVPDIEPAPDEEGEITVADYMPMNMSFGATPEEVNPEFHSGVQPETEHTEVKP